MVKRYVFLMKPKHQNRLSKYEEWVYSAQPRKERRLFCESMFISMKIRTSILKIVEREIVLTKPKHKYHLSQCEECDYAAQSWKERRLLCESIFILIERQTSILKMVESEIFLMKPMHQNHLSQ